MRSLQLAACLSRIGFQEQQIRRNESIVTNAIVLDRFCHCPR